MSTKIPLVRKRTHKSRQTKTILMFDEKARVEYLTGFSKRKKERQKRAKEQLETELKEERKRIKKEHREQILKHMREQPNVPEVAHLVNETVHQLPNHTVTVTEIDNSDFRDCGGLRLGFNQFQDSDEEENVEGEKEEEEEAGQVSKAGSSSTGNQSKLKNKLKERPKSFMHKHKTYSHKPLNPKLKNRGPTSKKDRRKRHRNQ